MSGVDTLTRDDDIDFVGILAALRKKGWLIVLVTLFCGAALLVGLSLISPRYDSTARILVRDGDNTFTRATGDTRLQQTDTRFDQQAVRSEVEIIRSDKLVLEVIDSLELAQLEEFEGAGKYRELRNQILELAGQTDRVSPPRRIAGGEAARNQALNVFKERLKVYAVENSRVIVIEFWSHNAELARLILQELADRYINRKRNAAIEEGESATVWLDPRIRELEEDVSKTEAAVAQFRANSDLLRADSNDALLATQQLSQVSTELSRLKAERSSAQAKAASIRNALKNGSSLDVIPEVIGSPLIQRLREREVELRASISDLSTTLLPNHPRMKALNSQLKDFRNQIATAANNIVKSLENNADLLRKSESDLEQEIDRLKDEATRVDKKLVELRALERQAEAAQVLLQEYKSRSLEAKSRSGLASIDAEIISPASLADEPFFPKILPFTIAGMVATALLAMLMVVAMGLLTTVGVSRKAHVEVRRQPVAAQEDDPALRDTEKHDEEEPPVRARNNFKELEGVLNRSRGHPASASSPTVPLSIRQIVQMLNHDPGTEIYVISPGHDLGSSTSWMMARAAAQNGADVVLIDLGGAAVCTRKMLGKGRFPGIFNLISGASEVGDVLYMDRNSTVTVVPAGNVFPGTSPDDLALLPEIIEAIAESFDMCIVDCGDAHINELETVAPDDSTIVISCIKTSDAEVEIAESDIHAHGYSRIVRVSPDKADLENTKQAA